MLAIAIGCFWGWQGWLIWQLHSENIQLQHQVTRLQTRVCTVQAISDAIEQKLLNRNIVIPGELPCPPQ